MTLSASLLVLAVLPSVSSLSEVAYAPAAELEKLNLFSLTPMKDYSQANFLTYVLSRGNSFALVC